MLVFTPLSPAELSTWASRKRLDIRGHAATPAFLEAFELPAADSEDADLTLLEVSGLAGLLEHGVRIVAVVQADADPIDPPEFGSVEAQRVAWSKVESLFTDDEQGAAEAERARVALGETTLEDAWDAPEVQDLLRTTELLWHDVSEWERL